MAPPVAGGRRGAGGRPVAALLACGLLAAAPAWTARETAPRLALESVVALDGHLLLEPGAWSPGGLRLALLETSPGRTPTRVAVFDAARPGDPPRVVHDGRHWVRGLGWSPDGSWLLVLAGNPSPEGLRWLIAVPADGAPAETLLAVADLWPALWGPDGDVHARVGGRWRVLAPPARWKAAASFTPRPLRTATAGSALRVRERGPGGGGDPLVPGTYFASAGEVRTIDALPDGSRALVAVPGAMGAGLRLVDARGRTLLDLRRAGIRFMPGALSADGARILGHAGRGGGGEEGWAETWLEGAGVDGGPGVRIAGGEGGSDPQCSREGDWVAWRTARGTRVGRLVVGRP